MTAKNTWATVAYGSQIKLHHTETTRVLHSHPHFYHHHGGSGQQQVTAFEGHDDNDWWIVKGPHGEPIANRFQQSVHHGDIIRLEHVATQRNLHSHGDFPSPVTGQQEVTCYGIAGVGDGNDNWRIEVEGGGTWDTGKRFRLIHVNTNHVLHSHAGFSHPQWTMGQQEVTCFAGRDHNDWWSVEPFLISTLRVVTRNAYYSYGQRLPEDYLQPQPGDSWQQRPEDHWQRHPEDSWQREPHNELVDAPQNDPQEAFIETLHKTYAQVSIPDNENTALPIVVLLHGASGNFDHMANPARSPGFNHDRQAAIPPLRDHGWRSYPGIGAWSYEQDPLKEVTSWQTALNHAGFRTINFSQFDPRGFLKFPITQLSQLLGDAMNHPKHQGRQFVLLGHSRGGLLARSVVALPTEERKFDLQRIQQIVTLHSPHQGSKVANFATTLAAIADSAQATLPEPAATALKEVFAWVEAEAGADVYHELEVGSNFLKELAAREPVPGIQYATFGGNSTVVSRFRKWEFTWGSKLPQRMPGNSILPKVGYHWQTEPEEMGDLMPERFVIFDKELLADELLNGAGDLLVADKSARLPWAPPHRTNPLNHAEVLWDPALQQQVISVITAGTAKAKAEVTYGSRVKIRHLATNKGLHSHPHFYSHPATSGQQQVTAFERTDDNDWWVVKGPHGEPDNYRFGQPVRQGDVIRLEHQLTGRNLHSHGGIPAPLSRLQEVTCYGENGQGDTNDNWRVELEMGQHWQSGNPMRLVHANTNQVLHSQPGLAHPSWTLNQQEVSCTGGRDLNNQWSVFVISAVPTVRERPEREEVLPPPVFSEDRPVVHQP